MRKSDARAKAFAALDSLIEALDELSHEPEDAYSREVREEVEHHERTRETELLAAAARISERNRRGGK